MESLRAFLRQELQSHPNRTRTVSFTTILEDFSVKLDTSIACGFDGTEDGDVGVALDVLWPTLHLMKRVLDLPPPHTKVTPMNDGIRLELIALERCGEALTQALHDGDMLTAQTLMQSKIPCQERCVSLVMEKLHVLSQLASPVGASQAHRTVAMKLSEDRLPNVGEEHHDVAVPTAIRLATQMAAAGCAAVRQRQSKYLYEISELQLEAHKEHLEHFRALYTTLTHLILKGRTRVESLDRSIRDAHVMLEFCVETFDPKKAREHAGEKKSLLQHRDAELANMSALEEKRGMYVKTFAESSQVALDAAGIEFTHPDDDECDSAVTLRRRLGYWCGPARISKTEEIQIAAERDELRRTRLHMSAVLPRSAPRAPPQASTSQSQVATPSILPSQAPTTAV